MLSPGLQESEAFSIDSSRPKMDAQTPVETALRERAVSTDSQRVVVLLTPADADIASSRYMNHFHPARWADMSQMRHSKDGPKADLEVYQKNFVPVHKIQRDLMYFT
ncbi:hypothetical protein PQX77_021725 [Marasmius sp. AFHP31]|nr:hypothetical protein PQX77_021725 [Marasmius sp. AFHP31]